MSLISVKKFIIITFLLFIISAVFAQNSTDSQKILYTSKQQQLRITANDVKILPDKNGGYHLYVRKTPNVCSIILTETTKDPSGKQDSYAYRAKEYNSINGDEIRFLDGKKLESELSKYSLVDSTTEKTDFFDEAFHIYIPQTIVYGYEWSRHGEVQIDKGTFLNIRSFEKPYADYSGDYMDSPFMFNVVQKKKAAPVVKKNPPTPKPIEEPEVIEDVTDEIEDDETVLTDDYNPIASEKFQEISNGFLYSKGPETIIQDISKIIEENINKSGDVDLIFAIDATGSMKNDIEVLKNELQIMLENTLAEKSRLQFGLLFYRDYGDTYKYMDLPVRCFPFTKNLESFNKNLNSIKILGKEGGDIPEAVYEAMYASSEFYKWRSDAQKVVILIGDAEPHPTPRGTKKYSKDYVLALAESKGIDIHAILLPRD